MLLGTAKVKERKPFDALTESAKLSEAAQEKVNAEEVIAEEPAKAAAGSQPSPPLRAARRHLLPHESTNTRRRRAGAH